MNQEKVWDKISLDWKKVKEKPLDGVPEFLKKNTGKVIDLGCGSGRHFQYIKGEIYATDFSQNMLNLAEKNCPKANLTKTKASKLPFQDNFFDAAIFIAALHCIDSEKERKKSLKELFRVLKPKTRALITVWSRNQGRVKNKPKEAKIPWTIDNEKYFRYYYIYEKEELEKLLGQIGFRIKSIREGKNIIVIVEKP